MSILGNSRLAAIVQDNQAHTRPAERVSELPLDQLRSGSQQPRRHFDQGSLEELAQSIRERGIQQPLIVRQGAKGYEIVAGERRWRAAQMAGLEKVPVIIRVFTDQEAAIVALMENLQRENLSPIDEIDGKLNLIARTLDMAVEEVPGRLTQLRYKPEPQAVEALETLFRPLGEKWESFARNKLRILNYPAPLIEALRRGMPMRVGTLIARTPEDQQQRLIEMAESGTRFQDLQKEVERLLKPPRVPRAKQVGKYLASSQMDRMSSELRAEVELWLAQMPAGFAKLVPDE